MKIHITSGTPDFMETIRKKHDKQTMFIMHGEGNTLLVHESEKKSVFATPRSFDVVDGANDIEQRGFFAMLNFPITDDADALLEQRLRNEGQSIASTAGLIAYRLLRPIKNDTYIMLTQWAGPASFELWQESDSYKTLFGNMPTSSTQNLFVSKPYITKYVAKPIGE
ncbi:MAG: antibiotic biosynthesis monooxygenase family protein [Caryophanon sp.]|nr:antibiotic biosynthesis monooxygenase family protein [Caryophanon sp.]